MKKSIFTLCCTLLIALSVSAQTDTAAIKLITLTASNMNLVNIAGNSTIASVANLPNASTFAAGDSVVWDLTNLYYDSVYTTTRLSGPSPYKFSDSAFYKFKNIDYHLLRLCYAALSGLTYNSVQVDTQAYVPFPGTPFTIEFPTNVIPLNSVYTLLPIPLTYPYPTWATSTQARANFNIFDTTLLPPTGHIYKYEPGYIIQNLSETNNVIGWGRIRVNRTDSNNGSLVKSGYVNVLQVKKTAQRIDSLNIKDTTGVNGKTSIYAAKTIYNKMLDSIGLQTVHNKTFIYYKYNLDTTAKTISAIDTITTTTPHHYDTIYKYTVDTASIDTTYDTTFRYIHRDTVNTYQILFYRIGTVTPLVTADFTDATFNTVKHVTVNTDVSMWNEGVGTVANNAESKILIYPNPVVNNQVSIDISGASGGEWSYELINTGGQVVSKNTIPSGGNQIHTQVVFPNKLAAGVYFMRIQNNGSDVSVKPLEIK